VEATGEIMSVKSSLVHNESFDMMGKNKKHIKDFMEAFEKVRSSAKTRMDNGSKTCEHKRFKQ
jgi:hypothetical protein